MLPLSMPKTVRRISGPSLIAGLVSGKSCYKQLQPVATLRISRSNRSCAIWVGGDRRAWLYAEVQHAGCTAPSSSLTLLGGACLLRPQETAKSAGFGACISLRAACTCQVVTSEASDRHQQHRHAFRSWRDGPEGDCHHARPGSNAPRSAMPMQLAPGTTDACKNVRGAGRAAGSPRALSAC